MVRRFLLGVATTSLMSSLAWGTLPPKVAIVSAPDTADLAGLVTAELSKDPNIRLIERDELAKIGDEYKIWQLADDDSIALGQLVGAEGLLILDQAQCRFTAVGLGCALFDDRIFPGADPAGLARAIARRIAAYASKLAPDAGAVPLSVLNLRADVATEESAALERKLTLLLESRLSALPGYVLLERRHAWPLSFERSLEPDPPSLMHGAYVVDGTMSLASPPDEVVIELRLRKPGSRPFLAEVRGPKNDPLGLVEQMTAEIQKAIGSPARSANWDRKSEAREFLLEGLWAWQSKAYDAALESLDSAELLGETAADLVPLRIDVLLRRAGRNLESFRADASSATREAMIDDTLRAIADTARYEAEKLEPQLDLLTWQRHPSVRTNQIKETVANFTSELLASLDARQSPRADELRKALRSVTGYHPLEGKLGLADFSNPLNVLIDRKDQWDLNLDEQLAYYRLLATVPHQYLPPGLLTGKGVGFCLRFLKSPAEQKEAFHRFFQDLKSDPHGQLAYQLIQACSAEGGAADAARAAFWEEMWKRREALVSQKIQVQEWTSARPMGPDQHRKSAQQMIPLLRYYLQHVNNYRYWEYAWETFWQPQQWTEADAAAIWGDFLGFKERAIADRRARGERPPNLSKFEEAFEKQFPDIVKSPAKFPNSGALMVSRLWHPQLVQGIPDVPMVVSDTAVNDDTLWLLCWVFGKTNERSALFKIRLPDLMAERIVLPEPMNGQGMSLGSHALYLDYHATAAPGQPRRIARLDLRSQTWDTRTPDVPWRDCFAVNDALYLGLESGLGRYDWRTGTFTLLASSRRKPAWNQFDDCDSYRVLNVFSGPGGRSAVTTDRGTYFIRDQPGEWPEVFDSAFGVQSVTSQGLTLNSSRRGEAVLLDPSQKSPVYLMAASEPRARKRAKIHQAPVKQRVPWAGQTLWDPVEGTDLDGIAAADGQSLCLVVTPEDSRQPFELLRYEVAGGRIPQRISFQFAWVPDLDAKLDRADQNYPRNLAISDKRTITDVFAAKDGICLISKNAGVWWLSRSEINAWLKDHPAVDAPEAPAGISIVRIPPKDEDVESQVIGDMIDPAVAEDSFR